MIKKGVKKMKSKIIETIVGLVIVTAFFTLVGIMTHLIDGI